MLFRVIVQKPRPSYKAKPEDYRSVYLVQAPTAAHAAVVLADQVLAGSLASIVSTEPVQDRVILLHP